jgi:hypothetical protein
MPFKKLPGQLLVGFFTVKKRQPQRAQRTQRKNYEKIIGAVMICGSL